MTLVCVFFWSTSSTESITSTLFFYPQRLAIGSFAAFGQSSLPAWDLCGRSLSTQPFESRSCWTKVAGIVSRSKIGLPCGCCVSLLFQDLAEKVLRLECRRVFRFGALIDVAMHKAGSQNEIPVRA